MGSVTNQKKPGSAEQIIVQKKKVLPIKKDPVLRQKTEESFNWNWWPFRTA